MPGRRGCLRVLLQVSGVEDVSGSEVATALAIAEDQLGLGGAEVFQRRPWRIYDAVLRPSCRKASTSGTRSEVVREVVAGVVDAIVEWDRCVAASPDPR